MRSIGGECMDVVVEKQLHESEEQLTALQVSIFITHQTSPPQNPCIIP